MSVMPQGRTTGRSGSGTNTPDLVIPSLVKQKIARV